MINKIITKLKNIWKKFKEFLFGKKLTKEQGFEKIFQWIKDNKPHILTETCICGSALTIYNIEKHYSKEYVHMLYHCKKCNCTTEKRYNYLMEEIKN